MLLIGAENLPDTLLNLDDKSSANTIDHNHLLDRSYLTSAPGPLSDYSLWMQEHGIPVLSLLHPERVGSDSLHRAGFEIGYSDDVHLDAFPAQDWIVTELGSLPDHEWIVTFLNYGAYSDGTSSSTQFAVPRDRHMKLFEKFRDRRIPASEFDESDLIGTEGSEKVVYAFDPEGEPHAGRRVSREGEPLRWFYRYEIWTPRTEARGSQSKNLFEVS